MTDTRYQVVQTVHGYAVHFLGIHIGTTPCRDAASTMASEHARVHQYPLTTTSRDIANAPPRL